MSADIRLSVGFWDHPKTRKLIKRLGLESVRSLQILWMWCAQNRPNGMLVGMDAEDIELSAQWGGEEGKFFKVLLELRWIDETPDGHVLHEWEQHNPWASGTESRSGKARLSRLSQIAPAAYRQCVADGKTELTPEEYAALKDSTPATEQRNASERLAPACNTLGESPANASATPAPAPAPSLTLNTKNKEYIYSAKSPAIAPEMEPAFPASGDAEHAQTAPIELKGKNKTLTGKRAESFLRFWEAFGYKKGRAEAIDAWSKIPELTDSLVEKIISGAIKYAEQRKHILEKGGTPKMAEGWITGKRWEDEPEEQYTGGLEGAFKKLGIPIPSQRQPVEPPVIQPEPQPVSEQDRPKTLAEFLQSHPEHAAAAYGRA